MSKGSSQSGFTLIELLVSLALLGLMMSLIGLAVPLAMKAAGRTSMLSDEISAIETAQHLLRRQIGEMPVYIIQQGYDRRVLFTGQPDRMRFPANPVAAQGHDGPRLIDLEIAPSGRGLRLVYTAGGEARDLAVNARRIAFSYYGAPEKGKPPAWHDGWKDTAHLPLLARIQIEPSAGALPWPDLVIAIKAGPPPP